MQVCSKLQRFVKNFGACQRGSIAVLYAASAIPVFVAAGSAIDYVRYFSNTTELQAALDSAALAAAATPEATDTERLALAEATFLRNLEGGNLAGEAITRSFDIEDETVVAAADMNMSTSLMQFAGIKAMKLSVGAEVAVPANKNAEIALVLDYSGSMNDSIAGGVKYVAMRNAAKDLISDLQAANPDKVKFALVPFSHHVYGTFDKSYILGQSGSGTWTGCTQDRKYPFNLTDASQPPITTQNGAIRRRRSISPRAAAPIPASISSWKPLTNDFDGLKTQLDS